MLAKLSCAIGAGLAVAAFPGTVAWLVPGAALAGLVVYENATTPVQRAALTMAVRRALPAPVRQVAESAATLRARALAPFSDEPAPSLPLLLAPVNPPDQPGAGSLPAITLGELASADNVLIVGNRGSGKTTLLQAIIAKRRRLSYVLDPHSAPGKWPAGTQVIGGGSDYPAIYAHLLKTTSLLVKRSQDMHQTGRTSFPALTLVSDEWGSVVSEIGELIGRDDPKPGKLLRRLQKEGRKFGISFIGAAHGDTAASTGSEGDTVAFQSSFDWIVYCGAFVRRQAPELRPPTIQNPQGGTLPLWALAVSPTTGERRILDLRGVEHYTPIALSPTPARADDAGTLAALLGVDLGAVPADRATGTRPVPAHQDAVPGAVPGTGTQEPGTGSPDDAGTGFDREIADALIAAGWSANRIYAKVGGKRAAVLAYVRERRGASAENLDEPGGDVPPAFRNIK